MLVDIRKVRSYVMNRILIIDDDKESLKGIDRGKFDNIKKSRFRDILFSQY